MSARAYACPQCGAPVPFQSSITTFAVCPFCRSMVVRMEEALRSLGEMALLPPDLSPLQIGTQGEWKGRTFRLIGRVRVEYEGGSWSEWYALFADGRSGWLGEAQGFFMFTEAASPSEKLPESAEGLKANAPLIFEGRTYLVVDVKTVKVIAAEGELPDVSPPGTRRKNSDLSAAEGRCGTLEFHEEGPELYLGEYATIESLKLRELRPVPGWSAEAPVQRQGAAALSCPQCGAAMELRAPGLTQAAVCGSCNTIVDTANPTWQFLQESHGAANKFKPEIPIGTRGELFGTLWEVIGLQKRATKDTSWLEYLLFNPWHGFRFLTTWGGHWNFVDRVLDLPRYNGQGMIHRGRLFRTFARGEVRVQAVLGEFYWKVKRGELAHFTDYTAPPELMTLEYYPELEERTYSLGTYVEPKEIQKAFGLPRMTSRQGVFANQPNPWAEKWRSLLPWFVLAVIVAICVQAGPSAQERRLAWSGTFRYEKLPTAAAALPSLNNFTPTPSAPFPSTIEQLQRDPALEANSVRNPNTVTTPRFQVSGAGTQPVRVDISAPVDNSWIGFDVELVNVATGTVYPAEVEVSYYHGRDSDGSWSEGGQSAGATLAEVPPGEYYLELEPEADPALQPLDYTVQVEAGGSFFSNFLLTLIAISAWPAFVFLRRRSWESSRWAESDFE